MQVNPKTSPQRLLVIKHGALGDIVQGFGAFASLRAGHPDAHIALLTTAPFVELANMMPWFDEVLVDRRAGVLHLQESWRMRQLIRDNWDMIVDLQCSQRTAHYFQFLRGQIQDGLAPPQAVQTRVLILLGLITTSACASPQKWLVVLPAVSDMGWLFDQAGTRQVAGREQNLMRFWCRDVRLPNRKNAGLPKILPRWPEHATKTIYRLC